MSPTDRTPRDIPRWGQALINGSIAGALILWMTNSLVPTLLEQNKALVAGFREEMAAVRVESTENRRAFLAGIDALRDVQRVHR